MKWLLSLALVGCGTASAADGGRDAGLDADRDAFVPHDASTDRGTDAMIPDGACIMVSPAVRCGDGVCDPGCERQSPLDCPADCPPPDGGVPCDGGPTKWTCNATATAVTRCFEGTTHWQLCGPPGSCHSVGGSYPDQCHACVPCTTWNSASPAHGQPYVYNCSTSVPTQRERCVDVSTGGDCIMGRSAAADCCVVTDTCLSGACVVQPVGVDDRCP